MMKWTCIPFNFIIFEFTQSIEGVGLEMQIK